MVNSWDDFLAPIREYAHELLKWPERLAQCEVEIGIETLDDV
jgi:hypothetical protein